MNTGQYIKAARVAAGLTQKQLADKLGISYVNISQLENGRSKRGPTLETLNKIAAALGISVSELTPPLNYWVDEDGAEHMEPMEEITQSQEIILKAFSRLNYAGQQRAIDYVEELTEMPKYQKKDGK